MLGPSGKAKNFPSGISFHIQNLFFQFKNFVLYFLGISLQIRYVIGLIRLGNLSVSSVITAISVIVWERHLKHTITDTIYSGKCCFAKLRDGGEDGSYTSS